MRHRIFTYAIIGITLTLIAVASACTTYALAPEPEKPLQVILKAPEPLPTRDDLDTSEIKRLTGMIRAELRAQKVK